MRQESIRSIITWAGIFAGSWWPLLVLGVLLSFCFIKPLGSWAVRGIQGMNQFVHARLFLPGAALLMHHRQLDSAWGSHLRLLWFGVLFASLVAGSFLAPVGIAFAVSMLGSWLALSVGGYWVGVESMALEDEDADEQTHHSVGLAHQIQPTGVMALLLVLFFIPVSFMTADASFNWFEAPDSTLRTWIFYALHLFYQAAVDVGEVIQLEVSNVRPVAHGGKALVVGHFIGLTFLVLNGLTLVARREHAIRSWIRRLETAGTTQGVQRFGARIWDDLLASAQSGDLSRHPEAALRALAGCHPPAPRHLARSPILRGMIELLQPEPRGTVSNLVPVRQAAAQALGTWRHHTAAEALIAVLLNKAEQTEVRTEAAASLGGYGNVPGVDPATLRSTLLEIVADGHTHRYVRVKAIDALIKVYGFAPDPAAVAPTLKQLTLRDKEPDAVNARALHALRVLNLLDDEVQELRRLYGLLESASLVDRKQAAAMLVEFGTQAETVRRLVRATSIEQEPVTRSQMVKALAKIAAAGHHHPELRSALLVESRNPRAEVRLESLGGLDALAFDADVAARFVELAGAGSLRVIERAKRLLAKKDLRSLPPELASRCRTVLVQSDAEEDSRSEAPLTSQEDAVVDSVVAVLREHPEIVEKLGGPDGLGDVIADEVAALQAAGPSLTKSLPLARRYPSLVPGQDVERSAADSARAAE